MPRCTCPHVPDAAPCECPVHDRPTKGRASALPEEIQIGPFQFEWDSHSHEMFINRGEEHVGTIEHVFKDTWEEFSREAKPYHGPG